MDQSSSGVLSPAVWNRLASDMECLLRTKYSAPFFVTETAGVSRTVSILLPENIAWGTLTTAWTSGLTVTLQPCASISDSTSTGAPTVAVYLQYPYGSVPQWCGYAVGDIVPYRIFTTGQKIALSNPLPRISKKYQSWYNNGGTGDGDPVSVVADFLRAISASDV
jgi:hypothetical protein